MKARVKGTQLLQGSLTLDTTTVGTQGYCQELSISIYSRIGCYLSSANPTPQEAQNRRRGHMPMAIRRKKGEGVAVLS